MAIPNITQKSSSSEKIAFFVHYSKVAKTFILRDSKVGKQEKPAIHLLVGMNGYVEFAKNPKLNVPNVDINAFCQLTRM